jgi:hypothetical protein
MRAQHSAYENHLPTLPMDVPVRFFRGGTVFRSPYAVSTWVEVDTGRVVTLNGAVGVLMSVN